MGRYVFVGIPGSAKILTLCEVAVHKIVKKALFVPFDGKKSGDQWIAVAGYNNWLQIGNGHWPACNLHTEIGNGQYGKPSWGTASGDNGFRKNLYCCLPPVSGSCWSSRLNGKYIQEQHGKNTNECYDFNTAKAKCEAANDCHGIATQSNVCSGKYRVTHGSTATLKTYSDWASYNLWAYTLDRSCLSTGDLTFFHHHP